ncbi:MAG: PDZ domain-containing protein, partial [Proteobacteria bacterium]
MKHFYLNSERIIKNRHFSRLTLFVFSIGAMTSLASADNYAGTYVGDNLTLVLRPVPNQTNHYRGTVSLGNRKFPAQVIFKANSLQGSFISGGQNFPFLLKRDGRDFALTSGNSTYHLHSFAKAATNPLSQNPLTKGDFRAVALASKKTSIAQKTPVDPRGGYLGLATSMDDAGQVRVFIVVAGGPAERAGLKEGDVIREISGQALTDEDEKS